MGFGAGIKGFGQPLGVQGLRFGVLGVQGVFLYTLRLCTLGLGPLNPRIWPLIRASGSPNLGLQKLRVQT